MDTVTAEDGKEYYHVEVPLDLLDQIPKEYRELALAQMKENVRAEIVLGNDPFRKHGLFAPSKKATVKQLEEDAMLFVIDKRSRESWDRVDQSKPHDVVKVGNEDIKKLHSLWKRYLPKDADDMERLFCPSDLFFSYTVPLPDIIIEEAENTSFVHTFRIVLYPDYKEHIENYLAYCDSVDAKGEPMDDGKDGCSVGLVIAQIQDAPYELGFPIVVTRKDRHIQFSDEAFVRGIPKGYQIDDISVGLGCLLYAGAMSIWYGIQLALLHPMEKRILVKAGKTKTKPLVKVDKKGTYKKGPTTYIRTVRMDMSSLDSIDNQTSGSGREYKRHTLAWRVIGHWRTYRNGKRVFIQPYWKGTLADLKRRDRRILLGGFNGEENEGGSSQTNGTAGS